MLQWPSEKKGSAPRVPLLHRRKKLDRDMVWGRGHRACVAGYEFHLSPRPIERGGDRFALLTEFEADRIRALASEVPTATWLDPDQQPIEVEIPTNNYIEYRVEAYHWAGIPERGLGGKPNGYMIEQEKNVQILVGREVRDNRVVREWEHDFEEVPLWHFIDRGCFGDSRWQSKFAEFIN